MKTKVQLMLAAMCFGGGITPALHAQVDVTEQYLVNPSFETGTLEGWIISSSGVNLGWNGANMDGDPNTKTGDYIYGIWNNPIPEYELSQTIQVPNGIYMVSCDLMVSKWSSGSRLTTQRLFANNVVTYFGKKSDYTEKNLVAGEEYSFAECTETEGDASAFQTIAVEKVTVTEGTLTIGIRTNGTSADGKVYTDRNGSGWFKVDNFRLYHLENGILDYYLTKLNAQINTASNFNQSELPRGTYAALNEVLDKAREVYDNSENEDEILATIEELKKQIEETRLAGDTYAALLELLNVDYEELIALEYSGKEAFEEARIAALDVLYEETTTRADVSKAIEDFNAAIVLYKFSGFESATSSNPIDATFLLQNPDMEKGTKGWDLNGFVSMGTGNNIANFGGTFLEKWVPSNTAMGDYSVSQTLTGLPNGVYTISAAAVACNQDNPDYEITGAYLFGNNTTESVKSENGVGVLFDLDVVVTDGTLTLGMKTVSTNANWVAFDNVSLAYYGNHSIEAYETAYSEQSAKANALLQSDLLHKDKEALQQVVTAAENADRSTIGNIEKVLSELNVAIGEAEVAVKGLKDFKSGSYVKVLEIKENLESTYDPQISELMAGVLRSQDEILRKDTTTAAVYPTLTSELDRYLSFATAYNACALFGISCSNDDIDQLVKEVLTSEITAVTENPDKMEESKVAFASVLSFSKTYLTAMECAFDEALYPEDARIELGVITFEQYGIVKTDLSKSSEAEKTIVLALSKMRFTGLEAGEETEVTAWSIKNPDIEILGVDEVPEGWTIDKINGNTYSTTGQHWSGMSSDRYLDSWNGTAGLLAYTAKQEIKGIPNGTYRLVVAARTSGNGSYVYTHGGDGIKMIEIPWNNNEHGGIWEAAEEGSDEKLANNETGYGWNWVEIPGINVNTNGMTIGCTTDSTVTGGASWGGKLWDGTWFSVDNFKLYWTSTDFSTGVEDVNADYAAGLNVYVENGYIKMEGAGEYTVTTLDGLPARTDAQLVPGVYIVKSATKTVKIMVP